MKPIKHTMPHGKIIREFIEAILTGKVKIEGLQNPDAKVKDLSLVLDSNKSIPLHKFLTENDWDHTIVGETNDISLEEQEAVVDYVDDCGPYRTLSSFFNPEFNLIPPDNNLQNKKCSEEDVIRYLKIIIRMQSAYNKARIKNPQSSEEVYHNFDNLNLDKGFYQPWGITSTTRDKGKFSHRPAKLVVRKNSDAIPVEKIVTDSELAKSLPDEKENFMGIRPIFNISSSTVGVKQKEYDATHINRKAMRGIRRMQTLFKENKPETSNDSAKEQEKKPKNSPK